MRPSIKIALIYLFCGLLWILLSDSALLYLLQGDELALSQLQTVKGIFFVSFTAILLYFLAERFYREIGNKLLALEESEKRYSDLFKLSPLPLWVFDVATLRFLAVNDAAVKHYGYTRAEFLSMTIADIRPDEDLPKLMETVSASGEEGKFAFRGVFRHLKKSREMIQVEIRSNEINYKGMPAKVVLVNDVTERMAYVSAIEQKKSELEEIAWMQSHVVRAPLATLMGFVHLLKEGEGTPDERTEMLNNVLFSANELDKVIHEIVEKAGKVSSPR